MNSKTRVLIVEDEVLIADTLHRHLESKGFDVVGKAISYAEAIDLIETRNPQIALLDICLSGEKTGIDLVKYIRNKDLKIPCIYLTSQVGGKNLSAAKETFPEGYLAKPIQIESLFTTLEIAIHNQSLETKINEDSILLKENDQNHLIFLKDILFVNADHVYVDIYLKEGKKITVRNSLQRMLEQLKGKNFAWVHRSYVVNLDHVTSWTKSILGIDKYQVPISRGKRKKTIALLDGN